MTPNKKPLTTIGEAIKQIWPDAEKPKSENLTTHMAGMSSSSKATSSGDYLDRVKERLQRKALRKLRKRRK